MAQDRKAVWLNKIWQEVQTLLGSDAYFRLWLKAQEAAQIPYGPIGQTIISNYASYQLAAIRRLCDRRRQDDVISLPKLLELIRQEQPYRATVVDSLLDRLKTEAEHLYTLATQYVAHNADPATTKNWKTWNLTSAQIASTHKAICEVAIIIERDLLLITQRTHLIAVYQGDVLAEIRPYVPQGEVSALRQFWDEHNDAVNSWLRIPRLT
ncbi:MAG TPA: hypothetical protein VHM88_26565 [Candidatus Acidoferrales bacterium]|nr:hypothetical protein [Candidatus Acidoferrales bacterium]